MQIIEHSAKVWGLCPVDFDSTLRWIERAARVCYNSQDRITEDSAKPFVERLLRKGHYGILEHSCLARVAFGYNDLSRFIRQIPGTGTMVGSWLAWCHWWGETPHIDIPEWHAGHDFRDNPLWRVTVEFVTDRTISHQLVRHRPASFLQRSQRYVRELDPIVVKGGWSLSPRGIATVQAAFDTYRALLDDGLRPEQARAVLPNCTATIVVMTTTVEHLHYIVNLRSTKACDPGMRALMASLCAELEKEEWWHVR